MEGAADFPEGSRLHWKVKLEVQSGICLALAVPASSPSLSLWDSQASLFSQ